TRSDRDWSSDVCSSDLGRPRLMPAFSTSWTACGILLSGGLARVTETTAGGSVYTLRLSWGCVVVSRCCAGAMRGSVLHKAATVRSEERRVGKEGRGGVA